MEIRDAKADIEDICKHQCEHFTSSLRAAKADLSESLIHIGAEAQKAVRFNDLLIETTKLQQQGAAVLNGVREVNGDLRCEFHQDFNELRHAVASVIPRVDQSLSLFLDEVKKQRACTQVTALPLSREDTGLRSPSSAPKVLAPSPALYSA